MTNVIGEIYLRSKISHDVKNKQKNEDFVIFFQLAGHNFLLTNLMPQKYRHDLIAKCYIILKNNFG